MSVFKYILAIFVSVLLIAVYSSFYYLVSKGLDPDQLYNQLSTFSVDDLRRPNYCQAFK